MLEHPCICARAHGERAHLGDEGWITGLGDGAKRKQPLQGVVFCCDEAVEAGGRVVLGFHSFSSLLFYLLCRINGRNGFSTRRASHSTRRIRSDYEGHRINWL